MPAVSIIIPVYRTEQYLEACIDSALAQTFTDFEIWLVDDGSPDGCPAICDRYALRDPRVHVIHQENGGLSAARNAGLERACGDYVSFLDSDDIMLPDLLETAVREIRRGYDMVWFRFFRVKESDGERWEEWSATGSWELRSEEDRLEFLKHFMLVPIMPWQVWNILFDRRKLEKWGIRFTDNREIYAEDMNFICRCCCRAERLLSIPDRLYLCLVRENSLSRAPGRAAENMALYLGRMSRNAEAVREWMEASGGCGLMLEEYPSIYFLFVRHELDRYARILRGGNMQVLRERVLKDLWRTGQEEIFRKQIDGIRKNRELLAGIGSLYKNRLALMTAEYLLRGGAVRFLLSRRILRLTTVMWRRLRALFTGTCAVPIDSRSPEK